MIVTTTQSVEGRRIVEYRGIVSGEAVVGANVFRDFFAKVRDIVGGRAAGYETVLSGARDAAMEDMRAEAQALGANAIVGVDLDYEVLGAENGMMMVTASGTAVVLA